MMLLVGLEVDPAPAAVLVVPCIGALGVLVPISVVAEHT